MAQLRNEKFVRLLRDPVFCCLSQAQQKSGENNFKKPPFLGIYEKTMKYFLQNFHLDTSF